jgi:ParB-like nuclease domain
MEVPSTGQGSIFKKLGHVTEMLVHVLCDGRLPRISLPRTPVNRDRSGVAGPQLDREDGRMTLVRIDHLLADTPIDPEAHLDAARVESYAQMLDTLAPVVVFDTPEGMLVADGYHRVAAARQRGWQTVEAVVRRGSR